MAKLKVLELFGGLGACSNALRNIGVDYELVDYVDFDPFVVKSFNAIYGTNFNWTDIINWDKDIEVDFIMHGSPCQDFSLAGKQAGGDEGSGTRSSLMYETIRIIKKLKPKYVVWENVKNLLSKKHRHNFDKYIETLNELGYKSFYKVLDAVDYGIPQTRQRVFTVSILNYDGEFEWPKTIPLKKEVKDFLEENPDRKLFLSDEMIKYITADNEKWTGNNKESIINKKIASTINTAEGNRRCEASNYISCKLGGGYNLKPLVRDIIHRNTSKNDN